MTPCALDLAQALVERQLHAATDRTRWPLGMQASIIQAALAQHGVRVHVQLQRCRVQGEMVYADIITLGQDCVSLRGARGWEACHAELRAQHAPLSVEMLDLAQTESFPEFALEPPTRAAYRQAIAEDCAWLAARQLQSSTPRTTPRKPGVRL